MVVIRTREGVPGSPDAVYAASSPTLIRVASTDCKPANRSAGTRPGNGTYIITTPVKNHMAKNRHRTMPAQRCATNNPRLMLIRNPEKCPHTQPSVESRWSPIQSCLFTYCNFVAFIGVARYDHAFMRAHVIAMNKEPPGTRSEGIAPRKGLRAGNRQSTAHSHHEEKGNHHAIT